MFNSEIVQVAEPGSRKAQISLRPRISDPFYSAQSLTAMNRFGKAASAAQVRRADPVCDLGRKLRRLSSKQVEVGGLPTGRSMFGPLAHLGERHACTVEAARAKLAGSTNCSRSLYSKAFGCDPEKENASFSGYPNLGGIYA